MKMNFWKKSALVVTVTVGFAACGVTSAEAAQDPTYNSNVQRALYHLKTAEGQIESVIQKISSEGSSSNQCSRFRNMYECKQQRACTWRQVDHTSNFYCIDKSTPGPAFTEESDLNENDWAAQRALLGLQQKNVQTIEYMEQALANGQLCDPCVKQKLCGDIQDLHRNVRAGRVAASLPVRGYATPQDFDDIAEEVDSAGRELGCY